jgi:hypothetical protein
MKGSFIARVCMLDVAYEVGCRRDVGSRATSQCDR